MRTYILFDFGFSVFYSFLKNLTNWKTTGFRFFGFPPPLRVENEKTGNLQ